ncbi:MAG TPA: hypothetical protein DEA71_08135 [Nitrospira sp.]|nr:hypothetical protein [Nitrospira sp.]
MVTAFRQHGYPVSVGRRPRRSSLNVVIEGFHSENSRDVLLNFCRSTGKRVAVIMTEHLDFQHGQIYFHGAPLGSRNDYMHSTTILTRMKHLLECLPYLRCFFVLGDLPELRNISTMLPGIDVCAIPFPTLEDSPCESLSTSDTVHDLVFTGAVTEYRAKLLALLEEAGISVVCPRRFVSRNHRNAINRFGKIILNIPQREGWQWLSLMRIIAGLQTGRATISLGTQDTSHIASCCTQLDIREDDWVSKVKECIGDWKSLYVRDLLSYSAMTQRFQQERPFPHYIFEYWSVTDRVCH